MSYASDTFTRVEVVSPSGRVLVCNPCKASGQIQDGGRTLKVFIDREPHYLPPMTHDEQPEDAGATAALSDEPR